MILPRSQAVPVTLPRIIPALAMAASAAALAFTFLGSPGRCVAGPPGLDQAAPVGKFFNGVFPASPPGGSGSWQAVDAFPSLTFRDPVRMVPEPRSNRLHIVGKGGYIWSFENSSSATSKTLMLDIHTRVQVTDNAGLVGLAFHPDWAVPGSPNRNFFYVFYYYSPSPIPALSVNQNLANPAYLRISRFTLADGQSVADPASELVLIQQYDRMSWHNGGEILFGTDGFLYIPIGDEGWDSDFYGTAQRRNGGLWGGVMRIDVDNDPVRSHPIRRQPQPGGTPPVGWPGSFSAQYGIPNDNPWQAPDGTQLEEYWCIGLRSPHTMTLDPVTGKMYSGDVGQETWEEINEITKGGNYQWGWMEGPAATGIAKPSPVLGTERPPLHSYTRSTGVCVICGPIYRGREHGAALGGKLLFADHEYKHVWALAPGTTTPEFLCDIPGGGFHANIASWGTDHQGEPYIVRLAGYENNGGKLLKLSRTGANVPDPPPHLSATGVFSNLSTLAPASGFIPFQPNCQFWSDGAVKSRWIAIPNDGVPNSDTERIGYSAAGDWAFPDGTILVKHFDLPVDDTNTAIRRKLETRFFVRGNGGTWYACTYRWREDESDADLLTIGETRTFSIPTGGGGARTQVWNFPSRQDCFTCHTSTAGMVLGMRTHQLNGPQMYPQTGRTANQLHTLSAVGLLYPGIPSEDQAAALLKAAAPEDLSAPLELRARSYLDANCAHCHRPSGVQPAFDLRLTTPLASQNLLLQPVLKDYAIFGQVVIAPHEPARSILLHRISLLGTDQMPPLGRNRIDTAGVAVVNQWINSLQPSGATPNGLKGEYFSGTTLQAPAAFSRTDTQVNFNWGTGSPNAAKLAADNFSVRWAGRVRTANAGSYTFTTVTDNGVRLWVNGTALIDAWVATPTGSRSASLTLPASQMVSLVMEYFESTGSAQAQLQWSGPGVTAGAIPAASLFYPPPPNGPPTAQNDAATLTRGAQATVPVAANDSDLESNINPSAISILTPPQHGSISGISAGAVTYQHNGQSATADSFVYTVADTTGAVSNPALVSLTILPPHAAWLEAHFSPAERNDPAISDWAADPDRDGAVNLVEFALDTHPRDPAQRPTPLVRTLFTAQGAFLEAEWRKSPTANVSLSPETSSALAVWQPPGPELTVVENSAALLRLRMGISGQPPQRYLRLKIALLP